jgi:murein DD-endopeptidase MepM/ murein hydrolase activator NlpD
MHGSDGQTHLVYELFIENTGKDELTLSRLEVLTTDAKRLLATYEDTAISDILFHGSPLDNPETQRVLKPRETIGAYLWLTFHSGESLPRSLKHSFVFQSSGKDLLLSELPASAVTVSADEPLVLGPPLRRGPWVAGHGPANNSKHRRSPILFMDQLTFSQRFAFDFVLINKAGRGFTGSVSRNENWAGYGAEVLAVADGVVAATTDGASENTPLDNLFDKAIPTTDPKAQAGNFVALSIGRNAFALYGHLQPGSIRVKPGARVRRGRVIGLVGNSGNSGAPHLHFQVSDGPFLHDSNGLPFVFDSFELRGSTTMGWTVGLEPKGSLAPDFDSVSKPQQSTLPLSNTVIQFR